MTFLGLEARTDLPKVGYPTALDFFVFLSFGFIFATIIQASRVFKYTQGFILICLFCSLRWCTTSPNTVQAKFTSAQNSTRTQNRPTATPGTLKIKKIHRQVN